MRKLTSLFAALFLLLGSTLHAQTNGEAADIKNGLYYIVSAMHWNDDEVKAIYANGDNISWKTIETDNLGFLWDFTKQENGNYQVSNVFNGLYWGSISMSSLVKFSQSPTSLQVQVNIDDNGEVAYNLSSEGNTGSYNYAHCESHSNGNGTEGNIVGWTANAEPSRWYLIEADNAELTEEIANAIYAKANYPILKAKALEALNIAKEISSMDINFETPLVTSADQMSSPHSETFEGSFEALLDGDPKTIWHSVWTSGSVKPGIHYIQVEMPDADLEHAVLQFTRRDINSDHITQWSVFGVNEDNDEIQKTDCSLLATLKTPYNGTPETIVTKAFPTKGYKYLRFYFEETNSNRGYAHLAEFQLYPVKLEQRVPNQYMFMGEVATNLEAVLERHEGKTVTYALYKELQDAYDLFIEKFVDPAPLRNTLATYADWVKVGTNPGECSEEVKAEWENLLAQAEAYDLAAVYTKEESQKWIDDINAAAEKMLAEVANTVQSSKWYTIQLPTEADFDQHPSWNKESMSHGDRNVFGCYLRAFETPGEHIVLAPEQTDMDYATWRFIEAGEHRYIVQNKATGLFLVGFTIGYRLTLSMTPHYIDVEALGYGLNSLNLTTLDGNNFGTIGGSSNWACEATQLGLAEVGSNSSFFIQEVGDVEEDYDGTTFTLQLRNGSVRAYWLPFAVASQDENAVLYTAGVNGNNIVLSSLPGNAAQAGQPFVLIYGNPAEYDAEAEPQDVLLTHDFQLAEPDQSGALHCCYESEWMEERIVAEENGFRAYDRNRGPYATFGQACINPDADCDFEGDITFEIMPDIPVGINAALSQVSLPGDIYTQDGRLVGKGNINTLKSLGRGIYILNGVKIAVK